MTTYIGNLSAKGIASAAWKIRKAFPDLDEGFYEVLSELAAKSNFTDMRMMDAVENVIKTCVYPRPTIAQFLSWDKRISMFTYDQMLKKHNELGNDPSFWNSFKRFQFSYMPKPVWIHLNDVEQYKIKES